MATPVRFLLEFKLHTGVPPLYRSAKKMKLILSLLVFVTLIGCGRNHNNMSTSILPSNGTVGDIVPDTQIYADPPQSTDPSKTNFYGLRDSDPSHRLYSIPTDTPIAEVVRVFAVGSHSEISYGDNAAETVAIVADKATKIREIIPCHVVFADSAGLKLRFDRQVTDDDLGKIEALFPEEQMMQAGLERYISEWDGDGSILEPLKQENLFHFWWD